MKLFFAFALLALASSQTSTLFLSIQLKNAPAAIDAAHLSSFNQTLPHLIASVVVLSEFQQYVQYIQVISTQTTYDAASKIAIVNVYFPSVPVSAQGQVKTLLTTQISSPSLISSLSAVLPGYLNCTVVLPGYLLSGCEFDSIKLASTANFGLRPVPDSDSEVSACEELVVPPDSSASASSVHNNDTIGYRYGLGALDSNQSWSATLDSAQGWAGEWWQWDLSTQRMVTGVVTQGRANLDQWVTQYTVFHSNDSTTWPAVDSFKKFIGNSDRSTKVRNNFTIPVNTRYIRIEPTVWYGWLSMRSAVLVTCDDSPPSIPPTSAPPVAHIVGLKMLVLGAVKTVDDPFDAALKAFEDVLPKIIEEEIENIAELTENTKNVLKDFVKKVDITQVHAYDYRYTPVGLWVYASFSSIPAGYIDMYAPLFDTYVVQNEKVQDFLAKFLPKILRCTTCTLNKFELLDDVAPSPSVPTLKPTNVTYTLNYPYCTGTSQVITTFQECQQAVENVGGPVKSHLNVTQIKWVNYTQGCFYHLNGTKVFFNTGGKTGSSTAGLYSAKGKGAICKKKSKVTYTLNYPYCNGTSQVITTFQECQQAVQNVGGPVKSHLNVTQIEWDNYQQGCFYHLNGTKVLFNTGGKTGPSTFGLYSAKGKGAICKKKSKGKLSTPLTNHTLHIDLEETSSVSTLTPAHAFLVVLVGAAALV